MPTFAAARLCNALCLSLIVAAGLNIAVAPQPACGQAVATVSSLTPEQKARLKEANAHAQEGLELFRQGKLEQAATVFEKVLVIDREVYGPEHAKLLIPLNTLASLHEQLANFSAARPFREEKLAICRKVHGADNWQTVDAKLALELLDLLDELSADERLQLIEAQRLNRQGLKLQTSGKTREALMVTQQSLAIYQKLVGEKQPIYATILFNVASYHKALGEYAQAEPLNRQSLEIRRTLLGENHPDYADSLNNLATLHQERGELAAAESLHLKALDIRKHVLGEEHKDYGTSLNNLAMIYKERGDTAKAEPLYLQALEIVKRTQGESHPSYARQLNNLGQLYRQRGDFAKAELFQQQALEIRKRVLGDQHPDYAQSLNNQADLYRARGDDAKAEPLLLKALEIRKLALGEEHPDYLTSLSNLASLYQARADYTSAERLLRQAIEISKRVSGEQHADHAGKLNNLATLYMDIGDYEAAERLYLQALDIKRRSIGDKHPDFALSLANLAVLYQTRGDSAKAKPLVEQALEIRKSAFGEEHPDYARSLYQLAKLCLEEGDIAQAEPLLRQSVEIRKRVLGEEHPEFAKSLDLLAVIHTGRGEYVQAEALQRQALEIRKKVLGEQHLDYSVSLNNLGFLYRTMGEPAKAEPLARQATEIVRQIKGDQHPDYATCLNNEAVMAELNGDMERAESLCRQSIEIWKQAFGEQHPKYAFGLANLAGMRQSQDDLKEAETLWRQAMEISQRQLELTATVQSERQQLAMTRQSRYVFDGYLSITARTKPPASETYPCVLLWKGLVTRRQQMARGLRKEQDPEVAELLADLQRTSQQLATLAQPTSPFILDGATRRRLQDLTVQKERQEAELTRRSAAFRAIRDEAALTPEQLQALLPEDTALIDLLEHVQVLAEKTPDGKSRVERHIAAFIVRRDSIERVDLGPAVAIATAVANWRTDVKTARRVDDGIEGSSMRLRELVWTPLEPHLDGIRTILVSPDGSLTGLPFGALPGREPGQFLIEERGIALIPVPQLLQNILTKPAEPEPAPPSLLGVRAMNSGPAPFWYGMLQSRRSWSGPKEGESELAAVKEIFQRAHPQPMLTTLSGKAATEKAIRESAPEFRYLHLDTHGFFMPVGTRSSDLFESTSTESLRFGDLFSRQSVTEIHPGLLSGIVLADADQTPQPNRDDGILTALEVANLDLTRVDLAVLSACETGLGTVAGGEGVLGLQRAFQNAGAQTVVCSLWAVEVTSTQALMTEFYSNLWEKKLGKLESLRQAQLTVIQRFDRTTGRLADEESDSSENGTPTRRRLPPVFWAGFVLSGDWR